MGATDPSVDKVEENENHMEGHSKWEGEGLQWFVHLLYPEYVHIQLIQILQFTAVHLINKGEIVQAA